MIAVPGQLTGAGGAADTGEEEVRRVELLDSRCLCQEWPGMFSGIITGPGTGREISSGVLCGPEVWSWIFRAGDS